MTNSIQIYPQIMINVNVPNEIKKTVAQLPAVLEVAKEIEEVFQDKGRVLIRPSGTEAKVRVMVEGNDLEKVKMFAEKAAEAVRKSI